MNSNPYAPPAAAYRCKRPLLSAYFNFALLATLLSCATGLCIAYETHKPLLSAACTLAFMACQFYLAAAACWIADRLSVEHPSRLPSTSSTKEEAP